MIEIINRQRKRRINPSRIRKMIERLTARYRLGDSEVAVVLAGDKAVRALNRKFMKQDRSTDVLSFPLGTKSSDGKYYLGDIIISVPAAVKQARAGGRSLDRELEILALHGFMHLAGFDHGRQISEKEKALRLELFGEAL